MIRGIIFARDCDNCEIDRECKTGKGCFECDCHDVESCYCAGKVKEEELKAGKCAKYKPIKPPELKFTGPGVIHVPQDYEIAEQEKLKCSLRWAKDKTEYALRYLEYALSRAEVGEVKNARLLAEVAERSFLRAFLFLQTAINDEKPEEKNS